MLTTDKGPHPLRILQYVMRRNRQTPLAILDFGSTLFNRGESMKHLELALIIYLFSLHFSISSWAADVPYDDNDFGCITQTEANRYVNDFDIDVASFGGMELCKSSVDTKKLFNDLQIIEKGEFLNMGSNLLIKNFLGSQAYYTWMRGQTRGMNRGNDIPWATAYNSGGYFTMQDGWAKLSTLGRVGTVIHEARHTAGYSHMRCNKGPYGGASTSGCDRDYSYGGSHAIEMEYYAKVSVLGSNYHPVYKTMARLMAIARTNFVFNTSPIRQKEAILALDSARLPILIDGEKSIVREAGTVEGRLKRTSFGAVLLNGIRALSIEMYENTGFKVPIDDTYSYFKLIDQPDSKVKAGLSDFEEIDLNTRRYAVALNNGTELRSYRFASGAWSNPVRMGTKVNILSPFEPNGQKGVFMIAENSDIFQLDPETLAIKNLNQKWPSDVSHVATINGQTYRLKSDGRIYVSDGKSEKSIAQNGPFVDMVSIPLYDAFEVK